MYATAPIINGLHAVQHVVGVFLDCIQGFSIVIIFIQTNFSHYCLTSFHFIFSMLQILFKIQIAYNILNLLLGNKPDGFSTHGVYSIFKVWNHIFYLEKPAVKVGFLLVHAALTDHELIYRGLWQNISGFALFPLDAVCQNKLFFVFNSFYYSGESEVNCANMVTFDLIVIHDVTRFK